MKQKRITVHPPRPRPVPPKPPSLTRAISFAFAVTIVLAVALYLYWAAPFSWITPWETKQLEVPLDSKKEKDPEMEALKWVLILIFGFVLIYFLSVIVALPRYIRDNFSYVKSLAEFRFNRLHPAIERGAMALWEDMYGVKNAWTAQEIEEKMPQFLRVLEKRMAARWTRTATLPNTNALESELRERTVFVVLSSAFWSLLTLDFLFPGSTSAQGNFRWKEVQSMLAVQYEHEMHMKEIKNKMENQLAGLKGIDIADEGDGENKSRGPNQRLLLQW